jgi:hypothetical protein
MPFLPSRSCLLAILFMLFGYPIHALLAILFMPVDYPVHALWLSCSCPLAILFMPFGFLVPKDFLII